MKHLGGQAHRALHLEVLVLSTTDEVSAHCVTIYSVSATYWHPFVGVLHHYAATMHTLLKVFDIPGCQCDPDPVDLTTLLLKTRLAGSWLNRGHLRGTKLTSVAWRQQVSDVPAA